MDFSSIQVSSAGNGWVKMKGKSCEETQYLMNVLKNEGHIKTIKFKPKTKINEAEIEVPATLVIKFLLFNYYGV